jgi:hypothetical protein
VKADAQRQVEMALAAVAGGAVVFFVMRHRQRAAAAAAPAAAPPTPLALQNTAFPVSTDVTVAPGQNVTESIAVGTIVIVWLPLGGKWRSVDGAGIADPVTPQAFDFAGPITHTYVWTDAANQTQTSVINFVVAPPTPVVTT